MSAAAVSHHLRRRLSTSAGAILNPSNPTAPLTSSQKSHLALSLLRSTSSPDQTLSICRAASLTPFSHLDRLALSAAATSLSSSSPSSLRSLLDPLPSPSHSALLFAKSNLLDDAVRTLKSSPSTKSFNSLLFGALISNNHDHLLRLFRELPRNHPQIVPDVESYNCVIKSLCESGSARSAFSMFEEMRKVKVKPNSASFNALIEGLYRENKSEEVGKALEMMNKCGIPRRVSTYNAMIQGLCKGKRTAEAVGLFEKMGRKRSLRPNVVTYQHLVYGFCKEGNLEEAKRVFGEMVKAEFFPGSKCYFTIIRSLCEGGEFEEALGFCKKSMEKNWVPCFSTMKTLVKGLAGCSKVEEAKEILVAVKEKFSSNAEMWKDVEEALA